MPKIGITSTVPVEVLFAAGYQPVDLNNIFINDPSPGRLVGLAERCGFPLNSCTWIKGIFSAALENQIGTVIAVTSGDCSNTLMLMEVLELNGVNAIPFAYPPEPDEKEMSRSLESFSARFGTSVAAAQESAERLRLCRGLLSKLDELTWEADLATGMENHYWLVSASDFNRDPQLFCSQLENAICQIENRMPFADENLRLAFCGVPAVYGQELYSFLEGQGARVVFNEVQRQFAMLGDAPCLATQYSKYTYPYPTQYRIEDIRAECSRRRIDGIIHYVQAFCHRAIGDIVFRRKLEYPILTLEGSTEFFLTQQTKTRLEAFLDMLRQYRKTKKEATWQPE
jgi:benzoyl-CoA reductase/2-hydroxyglutaryl-CoA dehydratase subunit BcrC/BadD/HgdB